jgi:TRAP-type C4-dicarboxylate transport system substrate-binding protein
MRHWRISIVTSALVVILAHAASSAPQTLKFSTTMPAVDPVVKDGVMPFLAAVEQDSAGTVKFQSFAGGQLTPNPTKQYDAMESGLDDITIIVAAYIPQVFPDSSLFALPDVVRSADEAAYGGWKMYAESLLRGTDKIHVLAVFSNDPASIFLARRVKSLDDLKGLKIRVSGPAEAQIVTALGGAPVGMDATQIAEALSRGIYDGSLNGWAVNRAYRASPLVKSAFDLSLGVRQFFLAMNQSVFDRLPVQARLAFDRNGGEALSLTLGRLLGGEGMKDRDAAVAKGIMVPLSPADRERLAGIYKPLVDKWVADTQGGAAKLGFLKAALAEYRKAH